MLDATCQRHSPCHDAVTRVDYAADGCRYAATPPADAELLLRYAVIAHAMLTIADAPAAMIRHVAASLCRRFCHAAVKIMLLCHYTLLPL